MIVDYFDHNLFSQLNKLHVGYTDLDISVSNIDDFVDYEVITDIIYEEVDSRKYFKHQNPTKNRYNILVGYGDAESLVFIKGISINISEYEIHSIQYNIVKISSEGPIIFDITEEFSYVNHVHLNQTTKVKPINKFTNFINELINDELEFSRGKIIHRNWYPIFGGELIVGTKGEKISDQLGVYGVNFKYEFLPRYVLKFLSEEYGISSNLIKNFTYRGETVCYCTNSNDYYIYKNGVIEPFDIPVTLINEHIAVREDKVILQWNGISWIDSSYMCDLVVYRAAFINKNNVIYRII